MDEWTPDPQEQGWREPPRRRPPTAVGVATPPPPRGPRHWRYRQTRIQRIGRAFALIAVATAGGLAAAELLSIPVLGLVLVSLAGARVIFRRGRSRFARVLNLGSNAARRAA